LDRSKPLIIDGVDVTKSYTAEDILSFFETGRLRSITDRGYCTQGTEEGLLQFVPWQESLAFRTPKTYVSEDFTEVMRQDVEREHPILRRTPQERKMAMAMRIASEVERTGSVPGLTDPEVNAIVGEAWRMGDPVSGETIVALAKELMEQAEKQNREHNAHKVTNDFMTA
jgi:hypothetical protein